MTRIQIHSVELKNYRQYEGKQTVELAASRSKNINVIEGENGAGKSNLLNAITFCLYDSEEHLEDFRDEGLSIYPLANRSTLEDVDEGEEVNGYVEVRLGRSEPEYRFKREFSTVKNGENSFSDASDDLELQRKEGTNWEIKDNPNAHLNQILPVDVRDYFLFDGERLDTFFEEEYAEKVERGIVDVSHIDLLDRAHRHLKRVRNDLQDEDDFSGREDEIREELNKRKERLDELEEERDTIKENLSETKQHIREKEQKLEDSDDKYVQSKQEQRSEAKDRLKKLREREAKLKDKSGNILAEAGPIVYCRDALEYTVDEVTELHDKGEMPPRIKDWFLRELIERGTCICGEDIGPDHEHSLEELLDDISDEPDEHETLEAKSEVPRILDYGNEKVEELLELRQDLRTVHQEQEEKQSQITEITEELKKYDTSDEEIDVDEIESQLEELENRKSKLEDRKKQVLKDIAVKEEERDEKDEELTEELGKKEKHKELVAKLEFLNEAIENVTSIRETVLEQIRTEAEEKVEEYFNQLIWKDEDYEIELQEDYTIRVLDEFGMDKIGSLSAGEKQVLALSFMSALTSISGFEAPIVIDTPLGRISGEPRNRIAENLPDYIEDTQLTFLMTDSEYTTQVESRLKDSLSNEYELHANGLQTKVI
jgi:DNA sulfur modification protein DndD